MKYDKSYYERYALLSITKSLKLNIDNFCENSDRPDLQNNIDSIGIEVTRAITSHEGFTIALTNKHFGLGKSGKAIKKEIIESKQPFYGNIWVSETDVAVISPTKGLIDVSHYLKTAEKSILKKSKKFDSYKKFKKNYLYLFLGFSPYSDKEVRNFLIKMIARVKFDGIFINCLDKIYFQDGSKFEVIKQTKQEQIANKSESLDLK